MIRLHQPIGGSEPVQMSDGVRQVFSRYMILRQ